jgi:hypothetical protein
MNILAEAVAARFSSQKSMLNLFLLSSGLAIFIHIAFVFLAIYALSMVDKAGEDKVGSFLRNNADKLIWLPALIAGLLFLAVMPAPHDDMLAISAIASGDFSHNSFEFSKWNSQPVSPWYGLEKVLTLLSGFVSNTVAMQIMQAITLLLTLISVTLAIKSRTDNTKASVLVTILLIGLAMGSMTVFRAANGRAEAIFCAWAIAAIWMRPALWIVLGILISPMYWLSWVYAPAALLLKTSNKNKVLLAAISFLGSISAWLLLAGGDYLTMFSLTSEWVSKRTVGIAENTNIVSAIGFSATALALTSITIVLAMKRLGSRDDWPLAFVAAWFMLPDMIRYLPIIATLSAVWIAGVSSKNEIKDSYDKIILILSAPLLVMFIKTLPTGDMDHLPKFKIPHGSVLMGALDEGLYASIHYNKGIRVTPAFEVGSTEPEIQNALKLLYEKGQLDCKVTRFYHIDYLIENKLKSIPACLQLDQIQPGWRLWKVTSMQRANL